MRSFRRAAVLAVLILSFHAARPAAAQEHRHPAAPPADSVAAADSAGMPGMAGMAMQPGPLGIPRSREGSGTSWLPDASPMHAVHGRAGAWELMLHGTLYVHYLDDAGDRGEDQFGATNWVMGMARRDVGGGDLTLRAMLSADPVTATGCGYPDLLATGEFCEGEPLHDRP